MQRDFTFRRRLIVALLGVLIAGDVALGVYSWQLVSAPRTTDKEISRKKTQLALYKGDIDRAQDIRKDMPNIKTDCDKFEQSLPAESISSSSLSSEFDDLAKKSGLQIVTLANRQKPVENRGLAEVSIDATVSGNYASVIKFVNGLQRSQRFYILDGLTLGTDNQNKAGGPLRVALHVRTYFRQAA